MGTSIMASASVGFWSCSEQYCGTSQREYVYWMYRQPMDWWPLRTSCWAARLASLVDHLDGRTAGWCYCCAGAALQAQVTDAGISSVFSFLAGDRTTWAVLDCGCSDSPTLPLPAAPLKKICNDGIWVREFGQVNLLVACGSGLRELAILQGQRPRRDEMRHCA